MFFYCIEVHYKIKNDVVIIMFLSEFKKFIIQGNIVDIGVGILMGASFTTIVKSFVNDIVMPVAGLFTSGINFSQQFIALDGKHYKTLSDAKEAMAPVITYGAFVNSMINFLIMAFVVFLVVRAINRMRKSNEDEQANTQDENSTVKDKLMLQEVRNLLRK